MPRKKKTSESTPVEETSTIPDGIDLDELAKATAAPAVVESVEPHVTSPMNPLPDAPRHVPPPVEPTTLPPGFQLGKKARTLGEVFMGLTRYQTKVEKAAWLAHNASQPLWYLLNLAFHPDREWLLPTGVPPFKAHQGRPGSAASDLRRELRRMYVFLKGSGDAVPRIKREKLFQQTLEGLERDEVFTLVAIKDRTLPETFGLTAEVVEQAFPGLLAAQFPIRFIR